MINVKEYADSKGVSTQAVYKQLKVHEEALKGHIKKIQGKRYLDEDAVKYLNGQSNNTPCVVVQSNSDERVKELEEENKTLRNEVYNLRKFMLDEILKRDDLQKRMTEEILKRDERVRELTDRFLMLATQKEEDPKPRWWKFRR